MRSLVVAAGLGFAALVASAAPAHAICAVNAPTRAPVVFVGVAAETERGFTRLAVEEVWKGPDLAPEVWVLSGQEAPPWPFS
ncbi:hypothetical protein [Mumia sp. ZJ430]|nr:hypothetical protein [Mumia sp. ZJ430]